MTLISLDDGAKLIGLQRIVENDANNDAADDAASDEERQQRKPATNKQSTLVPTGPEPFDTDPAMLEETGPGHCPDCAPWFPSRPGANRAVQKS